MTGYKYGQRREWAVRAILPDRFYESVLQGNQIAGEEVSAQVRMVNRGEVSVKRTVMGDR
jgi:hypothetical protein